MTRKSIGMLSGLALFAIAACTGSGGDNYFGAPTGDDPAWDPSAPPASTGDAPFTDGAPPSNDQPPGTDCGLLCDGASERCGSSDTVDEFEDCAQVCAGLPSQCQPLLGAYFRCAIANGCVDERNICERMLLDLIGCLGPTPPDDGGEGGQRGM